LVNGHLEKVTTVRSTANNFLISKILQLGEANMPGEAR
jgi:hypothetical protein